ncbi:diguanylate cyclase domain-containing protein [Sulfuriferula thiophila]|uniref:diguanylate cyclase domain-containing protein n=1 Tax=Sulfuriferula thiophila TaxID=1781211 RepID=UPI000F609194|nr:diguanylate cyclase [Sulfuriferula thiophila]
MHTPIQSEARVNPYSEALFHSLFQHMSSCVAIYVAVDDGNDFIFLDYNRAAELADKMKREDVIGKRLTVAFPGIREFGLVDVLQRVWKTGQPERLPATFYQDVHMSGWRDNYVYRLPTGEVVAIYEDITERKQAEIALRELNEKLNSLLNSMAEGAYGVDTDGNCTFVNQSCLQLLGYTTADEIIGKHIHELIHHSHPDGSYYPAQECRMYAAYQQQQKVHVVDEVFWRKDGVAIPVEYWSQPIFRDGNVVGAIATFLDISERKKNEATIHKLAFYDTLTQLPNRRLLLERLSQALLAARRSESYGAVMFIDLDNFKALNDTHGHAMGDLLLIEVAHRITDCLREVDTVARLGGDEFVVLLNELDKDRTESARHAGLIAEKIRSALAQAYILKLQQQDNADTMVEHRCTSSIGVALFNQHTLQDDVLKWADTAMYQAKEDGRNLVRFYQEKI